MVFVFFINSEYSVPIVLKYSSFIDFVLSTKMEDRVFILFPDILFVLNSSFFIDFVLSRNNMED